MQVRHGTMTYSYQEILQMVEEGMPLHFELITWEQLHHLAFKDNLTDVQIAELYGVIPATVANKRISWKLIYPIYKPDWRKNIKRQDGNTR